MSRLADERDRGGEHVVYNSVEGPDRVFKITHPGQAGLTIVTHQNSHGECNAALGSATPAEYLERFIIVNELFGDAVFFEGIIEGEQPSLIISQPKLEGVLPEQPEITAYLRDKMKFERVDTLIWHRPADGVVIGDTKRSNFLKTPDGEILPIDVAARFATPEMTASWSHPPPPQTPLRHWLETLRQK